MGEDFNRAGRRYSNLLFMPAVLMHELLHYLPAKILKCNPTISFNLNEPAYTEFETDDTKKMKVIGILPTVIGVLSAPLVVPLFSLSPAGTYLFFSWVLMTAPSLQDILLCVEKKSIEGV
jgi:hypothetical protein